MENHPRRLRKRNAAGVDTITRTRGSAQQMEKRAPFARKPTILQAFVDRGRPQASNNSGSWRNAQQVNSNNRSSVKKVYNVRQEQQEQLTGAHPDWQAFQHYMKWLKSGVTESEEPEDASPNND